MKIEQLSVKVLLPYVRNSRTHSDDQIGQIASSIKEFGFTNPILIDADNQIIAGHGRLMAANRLQMKEVPCIRLSHLTESQKRAYVIADNKLALNAGWDDELLALEIKDLQDLDFDVSLLGFSDDEISKIFNDAMEEKEGLTEDDEVPETPKEAISKIGDIWKLGDHKVMCGDSTMLDHVESLCSEIKIDCCWTDPPYNVNYEGTAGKIANDNLEDSQFRKFLYDAFVCAFTVMKDGAAIYIAHADTEGYNFRGAMLDSGFKLSGCLIWVKNSLVLGRSDYQWKHEPILYGWKKGAAHNWYSGRKETTVIESKNLPFVINSDGSIHIELANSILRISGDNLKAQELNSSIIKADKPKRNGEHPTMKPIELILQMLRNSSKRGDYVLDLFGGSGSTLIACEKIGRKARLMEFDPKFCDVIVKRWEDFTGKKAELINGDNSST